MYLFTCPEISYHTIGCDLWFLLVHTCLLGKTNSRCAPIQCSFLFFIFPNLLYLPNNFRICARFSCDLCFLLDITCLLGQKFQDTREDCLWFVVFTCSYLLSWPKISRLKLQFTVVCIFYFPKFHDLCSNSL